MTARRRLVPEKEVRSMYELLRSLGIEIGAVDIRSDGVTFYPPKQEAGNDYDKWKAKDSRGN